MNLVQEARGFAEVETQNESARLAICIWMLNYSTALGSCDMADCSSHSELMSKSHGARLVGTTQTKFGFSVLSEFISAVSEFGSFQILWTLGSGQ
jgi:hypothetical protein